MGGVARIRTGLVLVAIFAAALAFIGIQRIVALTDKSASIGTAAQTAERGLDLLELISHTERVASKLHYDELRERLEQVKVAKKNFIANLNPWLESMVALDPTFAPDKVLASIEAAFNSWRVSMVRLIEAPKNNDWYSPTIPRFDTKASLRMRGLVSRLVGHIQRQTIEMREQAAAGIRLLALIALVVAGIAALMAWRMRARLGAPIEGIYKVLGRALDGDLQRRTGLAPTDEIGRVGARIDRVLDRLEHNDLNRMHSLRPAGENYQAEKNHSHDETAGSTVEEEPMPPIDPQQASLPMTMMHKLPDTEDKDS